MAITVPITLTDGTTAYASDVMTDLQGIGNISQSNMDMTSAFDWTGRHTWVNTATTQAVLSITGSSLTTGKLGYFYSNSSDTGTRNLFSVINDNTSATGATVLYLQQDAASTPIANLVGSAGTTVLDVNSRGTLSSSTQYKCLLTRSADQAIVISTDTIVLFDQETYDTGGLHSTSVNTGRITIPTGGSGLYLFFASIIWEAPSADATKTLTSRFVYNGATTFAQTSSATPNINVRAQTICHAYLMSDTDYVEIQVSQDNSNPLNVRSSGTYFGCIKIW